MRGFAVEVDAYSTAFLAARVRRVIGARTRDVAAARAHRSSASPPTASATIPSRVIAWSLRDFCIRSVTGNNPAMATAERPRRRRHPRGRSTRRPPLEGYNTFEADRVLVEALRREGGDWAEERVSEVGAFAGSARAIRWGFEANENPPKLRTHDRFGNRIDEVEFHPAWHELLERRGRLRRSTRCPGASRSPARTSPAAAMFVASQAEAGRRLPDLDDLLGDPGAAQAARARRRVGAALHLARLRRRAAPGARQGGRALRDGDDREAGRLGRARQHHRRRRR